jgi:transcriptional regulator with XRE-family HTH domain
MPGMGTRQRAGDLGAADARHHLVAAGREIRDARLTLGMSLEAASRRAGMSPSQLGRIERAVIRRPTYDQVCRAARAVGLETSLRLFPSGAPVRDRGQLPLLGRFEAVLAAPLVLRREVGLRRLGDQRAWDGRIGGGERTASVEGESRLYDVQATARRVDLKQRDDPDAGVVILVVARSAHNQRVLAEHREALRQQFPLDGAAIARELRHGRVPRASGIIVL